MWRISSAPALHGLDMWWREVSWLTIGFFGINHRNEQNNENENHLLSFPLKF